MVEQSSVCPFLTLPLELREQVYEDVLTSTPGSTALLRVRREIYYECQKFLFLRPVSFSSQLDLYRWIDLVNPKHVHRITNFSLTVQDIDLTPLLNLHADRPLLWELYETELMKLVDYLSKLRNTKHLTLRLPLDRQSFFYREFLSMLLVRLPKIYPKLQHLIVEGNVHQQSLSFLSSFRELRSLQFDGFSSSSPSESTTILSSIPKLASLSLVTHHSMLTPVLRSHSTFSDKRNSFTPSVLERLRPLASFSIHETFVSGAGSGFFFTECMLQALRDAHAASLRTLSIVLSYTPDKVAMDSLREVVLASKIRHLECHWPALEPEMLRALLPSTLSTLSVSATSEIVSSGMLWAVCKEKEKLPHLEEIVLVSDAEERPVDITSGEKAGSNNTSLATPPDQPDLSLTLRSLARLGILVRKERRRG